MANIFNVWSGGLLYRQKFGENLDVREPYVTACNWSRRHGHTARRHWLIACPDVEQLTHGGRKPTSQVLPGAKATLLDKKVVHFFPA